ncbi:MAG: CDP-glycerol glycerophosphotransferase family protein [Dehalococcoidia bacterium]|nr:CDP-glycerol glycerophosphotransferase family protein [Dehalococcoidia bacterium]
MKKAFIVLDPKIEFGAGPLNKMNKVRKFLEANLWDSPLIRRFDKNYQISPVSLRYALTIQNPDTKESPSSKEIALSKETESYIFEQAIKLARSWSLHDRLPQLLQIDGVNIAECFHPKLVDRFFMLLRHIELADALFSQEKPNTVFIKSDLFSSGQAFEVVGKARGIKYKFVQPALYRRFHKWLISLLRNRTAKKNLLTNTLYSINDNRNNVSYRILADAPYINYFTTVLPVIEDLVNRNGCHCYILGKEEDVAAKLEGLEELNIKHEITVDLELRAKETEAYYHSELEDNAEFQKLFTYKDINFWSAARNDIGPLLHRKFLHTIFLNLDYFHKVLDTIKPDAVLLGCQERANVLAGRASLAKILGIPVLELQHGVFPLGTSAPQSDRIAIGGDYWKESYIKSGARDEQLVVTGWPKYDIHKSLKEESSREKRNTANILFATQPIDVRLNLDIIESIGTFIENHSELRLAVKPHPAERARTYYQTANKYKHVILHDSREDTARLIARSDALITVSSTVGIEAALQDKPIICINIANEEAKSVYVSSGVAIEVKHLDELVPAIKDALYDEEVRARLAEARKKFVYQHTYLQDGQASKRVADLIIQMVEESRKARVEA